MIFIVRVNAGVAPPLDIKMTRQTPAILPDSTGKIDFFCVGDAQAATTAGWPVVPVHDGWYADDRAGGVAIWGQGQFWEVRDTKFTVKEACGAEAWPAGSQPDQDAPLNIRQAIFRG